MTGGGRRDQDEEHGVRLQKVLASAGVGSRRVCEQLIVDGRVTVQGRGVAELGCRVDPRTAIVRVDGRQVDVRADSVYLALNKPAGVLSAMSDPHGRRTVADLLGDRTERLFHVGRLDADTEGLLIMTNDGDFAQRLSHPSHEIVKTYVAEVDGLVDRRLRGRLLDGVDLDDGPIRLDDFTVLDSNGGKSLVQLRLHSGRNRIVRRLLAEVGHPVARLVRTEIGGVRLAELAPGSLRQLSSGELSALLAAAEQQP